MLIQELKTLPEYFLPIKQGLKLFEVRSTAERAFNVGDSLRLREWNGTNYTGDDVLVQITYIPNGGQRACTTARRLKAEGVKSGVPDVSMPVPRGCYHGFYVEMKVGKNKPTDKQEHWLTQLQKQGYFVMVAYGWKEAADKIEKYLALQEGQKL